MESDRIVVDGIEASERHMEVAAQTVTEHRLLASQMRQLGFKASADFYKANANKAERWLAKVGQIRARRAATADNRSPLR